MLKRDFTKSNRDYFKKSKNILIALGVFILIGILVFAIFGMNGNFEINGYHEFSVTVTEEKTKHYSTHKNEIGDIINSFNGKFDNVLVSGEGDNTKYVVRYLQDVKEADILEINKLVAEKLDVDVESVSEHVKVKGVVNSSDYVYTAVSILLIILIASIFAYIRYNGASAMAIIIANFLGTIGFISIGAILRLQIGLSYFAMLVILNVLMILFAVNLFETMHKSSWLMSDNFGSAIETALNKSKLRMYFLTIALMAIGLLFVMIAPLTIKYVAMNIMFMAVILLAVGLYVVPFVWSVFITHCRKREYKIKGTVIEPKKK